MLNSYKDVSETLRRGITLGLKTKVFYEDAAGEITQLAAGFPQNLIMAFCPNLTTKHVKKHGKGIVVSGSTSQAYLDILDWMHTCAEAKKVVPFPKLQGFIFYRATRVGKAAELLGIQDLVEAMYARSKSIAKFQVHTDDIWKIYTDSDCEEYKTMVVQSIAKAIVENRLNAR